MATDPLAQLEQMARAAQGTGAQTGTPQITQPLAPAPGPSNPQKVTPTQAASNALDELQSQHQDRLATASAASAVFGSSPTGQTEGKQGDTQQAETGSAQPSSKQPTFDPNSRLYYSFEGNPNNQKSGPGAVAFGKDVGQGALEALPQAVSGAQRAVSSAFNGLNDFNDYLSHKIGLDKLPDVYVGARGLSTGVPSSQGDAIDRIRQFISKQYIDDPQSVTGGLIRNASQFITSMYLVSKLLPTGIPSSLKGAAAMFSGFSGAQGRLSDLIQSVPELRNPVTDFLSSKPGDNEAVGRLKNAVEGTGLAKIADLFVGAVRGLKGAQDVQGAASAPEPETPKVGAGFAVLGNAQDTENPLVSVQRVPAAPSGLEAGKRVEAGIATEGQTPQSVAAQPAEPQFHVNFARIDTPDDVKTAMGQMVNAQSDNIDLARRSVQSFEQTQLGAQSVDAWRTLMDRRVGEPLNDQEMLASRQLWQQSAVVTQQALEQARTTPTPENLLAFRKQFATHAMIQQEVLGAQAEVARSLSAMRIPVGAGDAERLSSIVDQLDAAGGFRSNLDFMQDVSKLFDAGHLEDIGNVAEKTLYATSRDALLTGWTNGLLTNPLTHVKVALSNVATIGLRLAETRTAEAMDRLTGEGNGVAAGETAQTAAGLVSGFRDAIRYVGKLAALMPEDNETTTGAIGRFNTENLAASNPGDNPALDAVRAFRSGHYSVGEAIKPGIGDTDWLNATGKGASEALNISSKTWVGAAVDRLASIATMPGRSLAAEHEFFRSIGMRMELNRFAIRQATQEVSGGTLDPKDFQGRIAQLVENPPRSISTAAVTGMTYQTFTDAPGAFAQHVESLRNEYPLLKVILPFYKIPSRMLSFNFERGPFAVLMSSWKADLAAGGARQSMALAKTGLGSLVMLSAVNEVLKNTLTGFGPADKAQRASMMAQGWQPYSMKVGDRWVQYNRLETVGSGMALAADMAETIRGFHSAVNADDDPDVERLTAAGIATLANNITSKTYLSGLANFFDAMSDPRANAYRVAKSMVGSVIPAGVSEAARLQDPYTRETYSMIDALKARTPGASESLAVMRDRWGEPVTHESGFGKAYDAFVPFSTRPDQSEPIDQEIQKEGFPVNLPPSRLALDGVSVDLKNNPKAYSRYVELAGNGLKLPTPEGELGLKDYLNNLVTGNSAMSHVYDQFEGGPDGGKWQMMRGIIEQYRKAAKQQLMQEFPDLQSRVELAQQKHEAMRTLVASP